MGDEGEEERQPSMCEQPEDKRGGGFRRKNENCWSSMGGPVRKNPFPSSPQKEKCILLSPPSRINPDGPSITWLRNRPSGRQIHKRNYYPFNEIMYFSSQKAHSCYRDVQGLCYVCLPFSPLFQFLSLYLCSGSWPEPKNTLSDTLGFCTLSSSLWCIAAYK